MKNIYLKPSVRKKTLERGISVPLDEELIMLILGSGTKQMPIDKMAQKILEVLDDTNPDNRIKKLLSLKGVGESKALSIAAALELGRRRNCHSKVRIQSTKDIVPFVKNYAMSSKEHFLVITLNGGHEIIQIHVVTIGILNRSIIHPREIFSEAIRENAASIILCHNHPSGNCNPSNDDIESTKMLIEASKIMHIRILDHIIVGTNNYYSFLDNNVIKFDTK